jgi:hypothetical protein
MLELADVVEELRVELVKAMAAGEKQGLRFEVGPVELELNVAVEREAIGKGGVRFWIIELGADARQQNSSTQTVKLTLNPKIVGSGAPPEISSPEILHEE